MTSVGNFSKTNDVTVEFFNVTLYESDWLIHSMNLIINQSLVSMTKFHLANYEGLFRVLCVLQGNYTGCDLLGYFECSQ